MSLIEDRKKTLVQFCQRYISKAYPSQEAVVDFLSKPESRTFYYGIDPTGPDIHLGHAVGLIVLKKIIEYGHRGVVLIGDFTAQIGDPTGKEHTRKILTEAEVRSNSQSYITDIEKIIPRGSFEVVYNGDWNSKLTLKEIKDLMSNFTVQQMIVRDMFQERLARNEPIFLHEFLYPLIQGYDSVALKTDGEIGGSDQTFNMLVGRDLVSKILHKEKFVLATHLLEDPKTGKKLMSKSEGGYIALSEEPNSMFGKVMSLPDSAILPIVRFATELSDKDVEKIQKRLNDKENPRDIKLDLATYIVSVYHGKNQATKARQEFESVFSHKEIPSTVETFDFDGSEILEGLVNSGLVASKSEAKRLIDQGAVMVDKERVNNWNRVLKKGEVVQIGPRKFFKIS